MNRKIFLLATIAAIFTANFAFSQIVWQKYAGNPVLVPTTEWEIAGVHVPRVLKIDNQYKMWYTALGIHRQIALATSNDGIQWTKSNVNPVLSIGNPGEFDSEHAANCVVVFHNNSYWMWYTGYNGAIWQIGLATSPDGIHWTKSSGNPVLTIGSNGAWDANSIYTPVVVIADQIDVRSLAEAFGIESRANANHLADAGNFAEKTRNSLGLVYSVLSSGFGLPAFLLYALPPAFYVRRNFHTSTR